MQTKAKQSWDTHARVEIKSKKINKKWRAYFWGELVAQPLWVERWGSCICLALTGSTLCFAGGKVNQWEALPQQPQCSVVCFVESGVLSSFRVIPLNPVCSTVVLSGPASTMHMMNSILFVVSAVVSCSLNILDYPREFSFSISKRRRPNSHSQGDNIWEKICKGFDLRMETQTVSKGIQGNYFNLKNLALLMRWFYSSETKNGLQNFKIELCCLYTLLQKQQKTNMPVFRLVSYFWELKSRGFRIMLVMKRHTGMPLGSS